MGKFKYRMKKLDFQTEEELSGSLRKLSAKGPADLLLDRYDTVFRRNLLPPEAPLDSDKKRVQKAKYKWHGKAGKVAKKLQKENQAKK